MLVAAVVAAVVVVATSGGRAGPQLGGPAGPEGVPLETGRVLAPAGAVAPAADSRYGVGCGATEQLATHIHTHLAVFVNGVLRPIPAGVGMVGQLQVQRTADATFVSGSSICLYWLHTHAQDGIIHVEGPAGRTFVLGQFFGIWGQPLTADRVGPATGPVTAYVNGHRWTQPLIDIPLSARGLIQLDVGRPVVGPRSINFPNTL
ncbi:MAG: hypothetical protein ACYDEN_00090 [Acidimicrobiales bacterium]